MTYDLAVSGVNILSELVLKPHTSTLNKTSIGLVNVDNTNNLDKPVSTATQTVLKLNTSALNKTAVGLMNIDSTSDADKPVSTLQLASISQREHTIATASPLRNILILI